MSSSDASGPSMAEPPFGNADFHPTGGISSPQIAGNPAFPHFDHSLQWLPLAKPFRILT
jgi:hypothetical protein